MTIRRWLAFLDSGQRWRWFDGGILGMRLRRVLDWLAGGRMRQANQAGDDGDEIYCDLHGDFFDSDGVCTSTGAVGELWCHERGEDLVWSVTDGP
jgi:hypothetical protein